MPDSNPPALSDVNVFSPLDLVQIGYDRKPVGQPFKTDPWLGEQLVVG